MCNHFSGRHWQLLTCSKSDRMQSCVSGLHRRGGDRAARSQCARGSGALHGGQRPQLKLGCLLQPQPLSAHFCARGQHRQGTTAYENMSKMRENMVVKAQVGCKALATHGTTCADSTSSRAPACLQPRAPAAGRDMPAGAQRHRLRRQHMHQPPPVLPCPHSFGPARLLTRLPRCCTPKLSCHPCLGMLQPGHSGSRLHRGGGLLRSCALYNPAQRPLQTVSVTPSTLRALVRDAARAASAPR